MTQSTNPYWQVPLGPVLATICGLSTTLLLGLVSWSLVKGVPGIAIGMFVGVLVASWLRWKSDWPVSIFASGLGAAVACYGAIATAELLPPGSIDWMWKGGLYGAAFGITIAAILSPLGLLGFQRGGN
ncbi:hypothetical protein [Aporhodopirellula aestuarii]|uniref:Uncharacterized protein n=1 Tax=Aporhodopirellula aestuarii TaxID=2950107 RepID=A0ABT0U0B1_9BACT|nr:hypothetical protein [Aporhodopirellula aestuarii]MCM2370306.1 hypothetical protein [Aporhodopirellula aestuarii]